MDSRDKDLITKEAVLAVVFENKNVWGSSGRIRGRIRQVQRLQQTVPNRWASAKKIFYQNVFVYMRDDKGTGMDMD